MQLDSPGAEVEAARRLLDRRLGEIEPDERDQPSAGAGREVERAVVARTEGREAVVLVEAEDVRAGDPVAVHDREQLVELPNHAVDVVAEMRVRVDDVRALRQLLLQL